MWGRAFARLRVAVGTGGLAACAAAGRLAVGCAPANDKKPSLVDGKYLPKRPEGEDGGGYPSPAVRHAEAQQGKLARGVIMQKRLDSVYVDVLRDMKVLAIGEFFREFRSIARVKETDLNSQDTDDVLDALEQHVAEYRRMHGSHRYESWPTSRRQREHDIDDLITGFKASQRQAETSYLRELMDYSNSMETGGGGGSSRLAAEDAGFTDEIPRAVRASCLACRVLSLMCRVSLCVCVRSRRLRARRCRRCVTRRWWTSGSCATTCACAKTTSS
jgi:hypothetical protein